MAKVRVYELAKELGTTSKKLIEIMEGMDIEVKNHMSTLEDEEAQRVIAILTGKADGERGGKGKGEGRGAPGEAPGERKALRQGEGEGGGGSPGRGKEGAGKEEAAPGKN